MISPGLMVGLAAGVRLREQVGQTR